jgi:hypothetical protein
LGGFGSDISHKDTFQEQKMIRELPVFRGWTLDVRLAQFRRINSETSELEFLDFASEEGDALLADYIATLDSTSEIFTSIMQRII